MNDILDKLATEFSGSEWGANGPLQLTKAMRKYCEDQMWSSEDGDTISQCKDVTVFKEEHFYPINWRKWPWMFNVKFIKTFSAPCYDTLSKFGNCLNWKQLQAEHAADAMSRLNKSFIVHLWGSKSQGRLFKLKWIFEYPSSEGGLQSTNLLFNYPELSDALWLRLSCPGSLGPGHDCLWPLPSLQGGHSAVLQPIRRLGYNLLANKGAATWPTVTALQLSNVKCLGEMRRTTIRVSGHGEVCR